ncbi:hypothetical protein CMI47_15400 [Candidatus Pacearchaeota archaeon]|nr:hypothetical protein [Candidatus Pacearchaeota archaeon]|tara:strand:- start:4214 stop:5215 length:1002 start_codon:yes stop_codon:yes gene_type:complete
MKKLSFLISAHNEEKIIRKALTPLLDLPYPNYEVVLGLDGCTDGTLEIVKEFQKKKPKVFKYVELNERKGKAHVLNLVFPKITGDILIIHDADWHFKVYNSPDLKKMIKWFDDDPKLGGILESYPVEWSSENAKTNRSMAFLAIAWTSYFWIEYLKKYHSVRKNGKLYADSKNNNFPFELNIMRRELYKDNETLGDAWERALDVLNQGFELRLAESEYLPRMQASYKEAAFKDIIKQKKRTAISREQIVKKYPQLDFNVLNFHFPVLFFLFKNLHKVKRIKALIGIFTWLGIMGSSMIYHQLVRVNSGIRKSWVKEQYVPGTHKSWVLRAKRK